MERSSAESIGAASEPCAGSGSRRQVGDTCSQHGGCDPWRKEELDFKLNSIAFAFQLLALPDTFWQKGAALLELRSQAKLQHGTLASEWERRRLAGRRIRGRASVHWQFSHKWVQSDSQERAGKVTLPLLRGRVGGLHGGGSHGHLRGGCSFARVSSVQQNGQSNACECKQPAACSMPSCSMPSAYASRLDSIEAATPGAHCK